MSSTRVAFITGANRGLGFQTALDLGKAGFTVVLGVRDPNKGEAALAKLRAAKITAELIAYDAERPETDAQVASYLDKKYGHLDVLVNNAGVMREEFGVKTASTVTRTQLRETFETNVFAVISLTQALLPVLRKAPAARIVNLSSILGSLGVHTAPDSPIAWAKAVAYDASKTALNVFTVHLADELAGTPIKVNSAHPGWVKTDMGTDKAPMEVEDGSKTSVYLATLPADGPTGGFFHLQDRLPW